MKRFYKTDIKKLGQLLGQDESGELAAAFLKELTIKRKLSRQTEELYWNIAEDFSYQTWGGTLSKYYLT